MPISDGATTPASSAPSRPSEPPTPERTPRPTIPRLPRGVAAPCSQSVPRRRRSPPARSTCRISTPASPARTSSSWLGSRGRACWRHCAKSSSRPGWAWSRSGSGDRSRPSCSGSSWRSSACIRPGSMRRICSSTPSMPGWWRGSSRRSSAAERIREANRARSADRGAIPDLGRDRGGRAVRGPSLSSQRRPLRRRVRHALRRDVLSAGDLVLPRGPGCERRRDRSGASSVARRDRMLRSRGRVLRSHGGAARGSPRHRAAAASPEASRIRTSTSRHEERGDSPNGALLRRRGCLSRRAHDRARRLDRRLCGVPRALSRAPIALAADFAPRPAASCTPGSVLPTVDVGCGRSASRPRSLQPCSPQCDVIHNPHTTQGKCRTSRCEERWPA